MMSLDSQSLTLELGKYMQALGLEELEAAEEQLEELVEDFSNLTSVETGDVGVGGELPVNPSDDL